MGDVLLFNSGLIYLKQNRIKRISAVFDIRIGGDQSITGAC